MKGHPSEQELALFAGGECSRLARYLLNRHIRDCRQCTADVGTFAILRSEVSETTMPEMDWRRLSAEMSANINLGLEAGECVKARRASPPAWNPRLGVAFASLALLAGAGFLLNRPAVHPVKSSSPVLESSGSGLELRDGASSLTILNHHGSIADQTVSARGEIGARYIDGETGAVTINNVYLE